MADVEFIVAPGQTYAARDLAETLAFELGLQAMPAEVTLGPFPAPPADPGTLLPVYVVIDPHGFTAAGGALPDPPLWRRTVVVWTAPPPVDPDDELVDQLQWAGAVFSTDRRTLGALLRAGAKARLLRAGYTRHHDRFRQGEPRAIDVAIVGVDSARRAELVPRITALLSDCRLHVESAPAPPRADEPQAPLAAPRRELLARSELVVAVHAGDDHQLDWPGALDAIHAGAVVVAEHASAISPLVAGEHLLVAAPDALAHVVRALLRDRVRLETVRSAAYERLRDWIPYALPASILRAAVVELIGEPLSVPELMAS